MSLRILFADDSVTAQNMGKKILTEAGYDVVAVSNGAAAVKKIAEQKPDIIILDLYMPGYSGLEVCEKVRASIATIKTPVLLTVGKMEPYKPEDANRVRADGVIIKPFEASDLLTIVKKFEERISQMPEAPAPASAPPPAAPPAEMSVTAPEPRTAEHPEQTTTRTPQPTVEVPDHMATASAFSDLLGSDAGQTPDASNVAAPTPVPELQPTPPPSVSAAPPVTEHEVPVSRLPEPEPVAPVTPPEIPAPPPTEKIPIEEPPAAAPARPRLIPVFQEPEAQQQYDFVPTGAPPVPELVITREPQLQESDEETTRSTVADRREPDLIPTQHQFQEPHAGTTVEFDLPQQMQPQATTPSPAPEIQNAAPQPAVEASPVEAHSTAATPVAPSVSDGDFEARVAAAMAAYDHPPEVATPAPSPAAEPVAPVRAEAPEVAPPPPPPPVQYQQPVSAPENHHQVQEPTPHTAPEPVPPVTAEQEPSPPDTSTVEHEEVAVRIEDELPAAAVAAAKAAVEAGGDHQTIAQAVNRVMERVKGDLVDEILRELKSKK